MKTTAIICEFNPLHSGHKKLIEFAKTFSDKVICIMSGNFTQRGMPACADKYARAAHAILAGADLVVELPTVFATSSAENFAYGGVSIAKEMNVDFLLFGSECGNVEKLKDCADKLTDKKTNEQIALEVSKGLSYPKAVANALKIDLLNSPNNILAIEYIKAINCLKSHIIPVTMQREDNFNGKPQEYASSGTLRKEIALREKYSYDYVIKDIDDTIENKYGIIATSLIALKSAEELRNIEGVSEGLEHRIFNADKTHGYEYMLQDVKTKRYTRLRLQRIILNAILNITKETVQESKKNILPLKVLAVKSSETSLLKNIAVNENDELTKKADRLFYAISGTTPPRKLLKID